MKSTLLSLLSMTIGLGLLSSIPASAEGETRGILVYKEPGTTYAEAFEYRSFRQDNALFSTMVTNVGTRKRLKSGGVLALLPYPVGNFGVDPAAAKTALHEIADLEASYPRVKPQLELARGKWVRAAAVYEQGQAAKPVPRHGPQTHLTLDRWKPRPLPPGASLTGATATRAEILSTNGLVTSVPLNELSPEQVLNLNATSRHVQLPLGIEPTQPAPTGAGANLSRDLAEGELTRKIDLAGRRTVGFGARSIGVSASAFSVWTFFVVLPGLVLVLLVMVIWMAARPPVTKLPPVRR